MKSLSKYTLLIISLLILGGASCSSRGSGETRISLSTAARNTLVVAFDDEFGTVMFDQDPLTSDTSHWNVNGKAPEQVYHRSRSIDEKPKDSNGEYPVSRAYWIYLVLDHDLVAGKNYLIESPYGSVSFIFNPKQMICESIKVNQVSYLPSSRVRYANLGVYMGDGGSIRFSEPPPYQVLRASDHHPVYSGTAEYRGDDTSVSPDRVSSGEYVYRLDLSEVPQGGPYLVYLEGAGISPPFFISNEKVGEIASTYARFLYHQRCGMVLQQPYSEFERDACHTQVRDTREPWSASGKIRATGSQPLIEVTGGYHDAGDFDRRPFHAIIPILMLGYYEAFPSHFSDGQYDIAESGNTLPDLLDEALWGLLLWENLQILDPLDAHYGAVRAGTETSGHPEYGKVDSGTDAMVYGTWEATGEVTAFACGMMAQAARLLSTFDGFSQRSIELYQRAQLAWQALPVFYDDMREKPTGAVMYAALQMALATRVLEPEKESAIRESEDLFISLAHDLLVSDGYWPQQYRPGNSMAKIQTVHFSSFLLMRESFDEQLRQQLSEIVIRQAEKGGYMGFDLSIPFYPQGATKAYGWGAATAQGRYGDPIAFAYRLSEDEQKRSDYLSMLSQLADYALGLNPLGQSYVTGLGTNQVNSPLHLDSYTAKEEGLGNIPGLLIYGPSEGRSNADYQRVISDTLYPEWEQLPLQRRWADGWSLVNNNEFTVWETSVWNLCLYGVLYDGSFDSP
ncbi:MAG: glycoside hydrolase family 9 protein [Sphaerochaetaceae bacterium]|nr:glycoside hydrolase family 9 protein [Sphaerochaetaceae bacterium]